MRSITSTSRVGCLSAQKEQSQNKIISSTRGKQWAQQMNLLKTLPSTSTLKMKKNKSNANSRAMTNLTIMRKMKISSGLNHTV